MTLNQIFAICYVIECQFDEDGGELGLQIANTMTSKLYKPYYYIDLVQWGYISPYKLKEVKFTANCLNSKSYFTREISFKYLNYLMTEILSLNSFFNYFTMVNTSISINFN
jgi:hypothetical protein